MCLVKNVLEEGCDATKMKEDGKHTKCSGTGEKGQFNATQNHATLLFNISMFILYV